jgi:hypothetical protein
MHIAQIDAHWLPAALLAITDYDRAASHASWALHAAANVQAACTAWSTPCFPLSTTSSLTTCWSC